MKTKPLLCALAGVGVVLSSCASDPTLARVEMSSSGSHDFTPHHFTTALKLIQHGIVKVKPLISHVLPLEEIASAFDIVAERKGLKVMITID